MVMKHSNAARQADLMPADDPGGVPAVRDAGLMAMFERFVSDPNASVEKIERLMALWERNEAKKAEQAFNAAMADCQAEMRPVNADAWNPQTRSKYASYAALDNALRPIYTKHGFALSFDTGDAPEPLMVRVLCYVSHREGHSRPYRVDMPADGKGAKGGDVMTRTHASASGMSYGQRYLLKLIFNIAVGDGDDDGNAAGQKEVKAVAVPEGYADWLAGLAEITDKGTAALMAEFNRGSDASRKYLARHQNQEWEQLKALAAKAGK